MGKFFNFDCDYFSKVLDALFHDSIRIAFGVYKSGSIARAFPLGEKIVSLGLFESILSCPVS